MKNWILLGALLCAGTQAWSQSWQRLSRVKAGASIVIETQPWRYGAVEVDRCKLISVEPDTLTCVDPRWGRLVFPAQEVNSVYEVHKSRAGLIAALIACAAAGGLIIGGAATGNYAAVLFGGVILLFTGVANAHLPLLGSPPFAVGSPASQPRRGEREQLVYLRPAP